MNDKCSYKRNSDRVSFFFDDDAGNHVRLKKAFGVFLKQGWGSFSLCIIRYHPTQDIDKSGDENGTCDSAL